MESSYSELHSKCVINVSDGKNLGRVCDLVFTYPKWTVSGIVVPGKQGFHLFHRNDIFISVTNIVKIGADAVLVDIHGCRPTGKCDNQNCNGSRRDYTEYE